MNVPEEVKFRTGRFDFFQQFRTAVAPSPVEVENIQWRTMGDENFGVARHTSVLMLVSSVEYVSHKKGNAVEVHTVNADPRTTQVVAIVV